MDLQCKVILGLIVGDRIGCIAERALSICLT